MDRRSWPWKKKSSDKSAVERAAALLDSANAALQVSQDQDDVTKPSHVQISFETYSHLTGLEEKVKTCEEKVQSLEEEIEELNEKLSAANAEITTKENMVKQHTKVAEEAVSGWEKAEAEASALKGHLESVTLEKLAAEDRASHLDGALKECMKQIRNLKEEHEKNLEEVVLVKTKQLEKITNEFEAKIVSISQELLKSEADNSALSRSLQERSNMVIKLSEEKSKAEAEIELFKSNIESCEREIGRLKYEVHLVSKELDIRNEEKNMSVRSAEVANKQHMEGVKKIAKLEAECQRLRGLVRKKLPGPAALAQMRVEVENLGREYGDPHFRRSLIKPASPHRSPVLEFGFDNLQKVQRENEFLTERLYAMEEETKMLKEALAMRNSELQASRSACAQTASKLQHMESHLLVYNASNPPSLASMSEDGNEEDRNVVGPRVERSQFKEKNFEKPVKGDIPNHLDLMDDFLEMEKLANNSDETIPAADSSVKSQLSEPPISRQGSGVDQLQWVKLQSRILGILEETTETYNVDKVLEEIKLVLQEPCDLCSHGDEGKHCSNAVLVDGKAPLEEVSGVSESDSKATARAGQTSDLDLGSSLLHIYEFVMLLGKEVMDPRDISVDNCGLGELIEEFSATYHKFQNKDTDLANVVDDLSRVFEKARQLKFKVLEKGNDSGVSSPDCIDKVALPEDGAFHRDSSRNGYPNGSASNIMDLASNPDVSDDSNTNSDYEASTSVGILVEDHDKLRSENEKLAKDLAISEENLEKIKSQVQGLEQTVAEVKSQLASAQKSNSLAETQLKCMAGSYRSLEERAEELQREVELLVAKNESLSRDLEEEKSSHQETLVKCNDLEECLSRMESSSSQADTNLKSKQEHDLAAAAEKLAECQETIFLLGKQLKALHPQVGLPPANATNLQAILEQVDDSVTTTMNTREAGDRSPPHSYPVPTSPLESDSNLMRSPVNSKHRATLSGSSYSSSSSERQSRGFSRFFSTKG
ncbi:hypothetical protein MLD38_001816 [Melastoma candidum]|uniref:Uncharacterized protein n=1 Tax=Melastoma candidum TaxID=119954 RepID=A0ACB9SEG1_9MYRT|nr:hypothetical protein MLD38_001816 [Melastoma candidum]